MNENSFLLGQRKVNLVKVRKAIEDIGYEGWLQIKGTVPAKADMTASFKANLKYLRGLFGGSGNESNGVGSGQYK